MARAHVDSDPRLKSSSYWEFNPPGRMTLLVIFVSFDTNPGDVKLPSLAGYSRFHSVGSPSSNPINTRPWVEPLTSQFCVKWRPATLMSRQTRDIGLLL